MNRTKKCNYNRIKYVAPQNPIDGEGLFDIFKSTGKKKLHHLQLPSFPKKLPKKLLQQVSKSLQCLVRKLLAKVLQTKL